MDTKVNKLLTLKEEFKANVKASIKKIDEEGLAYEEKRNQIVDIMEEEATKFVGTLFIRTILALFKKI